MQGPGVLSKEMGGKTKKPWMTHHCPNVSTTPLRQWGFRQCLPFSWTTLSCRYIQGLAISKASNQDEFQYMYNIDKILRCG